ncbi:hypothetical protein GGR55DRAFT_256238 [Xylaria sp. FL0064]|nr:hypothetical protein GGR55DRAFT_256238 [Xylaria sp. FL0064]
MPLKRGLERESCDFCFRRKIKCDRSARAATGRPACSQCDLRQTPCTFECDDIRIQRRRKNSPQENTLDTITPTEPKPGQQTIYGFIGNDESTCAVSQALTINGSDNSPTLFYDNTSVSSYLPPDISNAISIQSLATTSSLPDYSDFEFELSPNNVSFLDLIFLQGHETTEATTNGNAIPDLALQFLHEGQKSLAPNVVPNKSPYCDTDIQPELLDAAIDAYFSFASLALPILSKDGFMTDYKAHQSSSALVFAVACRGCPFTRAREKWSLQQRFAFRFREAFLQVRSTTSNQDVVRLDDLEALALMEDFEYESSEGLTSPLQSQLGNLLLTHDSLVVMTLQYRIETRTTAATGQSTNLCRAAQRQILLFWYVYGWDAFFCLDRKMVSRIQDEDVYLSRQLDEHESQSYFDAILGLAVIARKMSRALCGPLARRQGVRHHDVESLYKQLKDWRKNTCPAAAHIRYSSPAPAPQEGSLSLSTNSNEFLPIQKAVIALLELNCFMQLEACVSQYGIEKSGSPIGQIVAMRVKYETLQAAYRIVEVARWADKVTADHGISTSPNTFPMADLEPGVVRNICSGAFNWISRQAEEMFHSTNREGLNPTTREFDYVVDSGSTAELSRERVKNWVDALATLRDTAATATSHRDTKHFITRLDQRLGSLKALVNTHEEC